VCFSCWSSPRATTRRKTETERLRAESEAAKAEFRDRQKPGTSISEFTNLKEGEKHAWRMEPGSYRVRVTSGGAGVKVKWVGTACADSKGEVKVYDVVCEIAADAQLIIENPGGLTRSGPTESVTVLATPI
jgi:hypothetical protein